MPTPENGRLTPDFPYDDLHADLAGDEAGRETLDRLRHAIASEAVRRADVESHVGLLQAIPVVRARVANWFDSPGTQRWLDGLSEIL